MVKKSAFALVSLLVLTACSTSGSQVYLDSGSVTLSQAVPGKIQAPATLVGFLPSVPVGSEFSDGGSVSVKGKVPVTKSVVKAPLIGYFGGEKTFRSAGSVTLHGKIN